MVTTAPPPAASISGSAARAHATSEYALTSSASQKRSRGVSVKRPSRSSAAANATEWTSRSSCPSDAVPTSSKTRATSSSERTSHAVTCGLETDSASSRTLFSIRSPWYVNASCAPPSARRFAIAQAGRTGRRAGTPPFSRRYLAHVATVQRAAAAQLVRAIPQARIGRRFQVVLDGLTVSLPFTKLPTLARLSFVQKIYPSATYRLLTDTSPGVIGADQLHTLTGARGDRKSTRLNSS